MSLQWDLVAGVPSSPQINTGTTLPTIEGVTFIAFIQVTTYAAPPDFMGIFALENSGVGTRAAWLETNNAGELLLANGSGATAVLWNDSYTGWAAVGFVGTVANIIGYYQRFPTGAFTTSGTIASPAGALTYMAIAGEQQFDTAMDGIINISAPRIHNASFTAQQVSREFWTRKQRIWTNQRFWNPFFDAAAPQINRTGVGADFTLVGTPTQNPSDPPVPWQRMRSYVYS